MRTVHKFPLNSHRFAIQVERGARPLCVQMQSDTPTLWMEVNTGNPKVPRSIEAFGTGHPIPDTYQGEYCGTFQVDSPMSRLVFHVYLGPEPGRKWPNEDEVRPLKPVVPNGPDETRLQAAIRLHGAHSPEAIAEFEAVRRL